MDVAVLHDICASGKFRDQAGNEIDVRKTSIDRKECEFLSGIIAADESIRRTLEIGCALGVSSLCICQALQGRPGAHHTILDPYQTSRWNRTGLHLLERAGCERFDFREEPSELAMPQLLKEHEGGFDLIFIDGYHTFDHSLVDLFYATRLLRVGGLVIIDDANMRTVAKAIAYFKRYPCYKLHSQSPANSRLSQWAHQALQTLLPPAVAGWLIPRILYDHVVAHRLNTSMVALQKIAPDDRHQKWFASF